jgi:hypothetical protein
MPGTGYQVIREATLREVLEHFLRAEMVRPKYTERREHLVEWLTLDDAAFLQRMREFAASRDDVNPVLTWTVGTRANRHHESVRRRILARVPISTLYSCRINEATMADLNAVHGNLARFSKIAHKYPEFRMDSVLAPDQLTIIAVAREHAGRDGTVELLDGVHRVVPMAGAGIPEVMAFLA